MARRLTRIALWLAAVTALLGLLELLGVPAFDWINDLFDRVADVPAWAIVAGVLLESAQTSLAALAWYGILRAALPDAVMPYRLVLASYAVAVALNGFPAGQPRHLCDAGDVHDPDRRSDLLLGLRLVGWQGARQVLLRRGQGALGLSQATQS